MVGREQVIAVAGPLDTGPHLSAPSTQDNIDKYESTHLGQRVVPVRPRRTSADGR